jgi:uncharacterized protein DUF3618
MSGDNRTADEVRAEIAQTRGELGETAAALAAKTDVKARVTKAAAAKTAEVKQAAAEKTAEVKHAVAEKTAQVKQAAAETTAHVAQAAAEKTAEVKQATALAALVATEAGSDAADNVRHQFTDGEPAEVVRRPVPLALLGAAALGVAVIVAVLLRRRR